MVDSGLSRRNVEGAVGRVAAVGRWYPKASDKEVTQGQGPELIRGKTKAGAGGSAGAPEAAPYGSGTVVGMGGVGSGRRWQYGAGGLLCYS